MATEIDFLRQSCGRPRPEGIRNEQIRNEISMDRNMKEKGQLIWFARKSKRADIDDAMTARNLEEELTNDKKNGNRVPKSGESCSKSLIQGVLKIAHNIHTT